MRHAIKFCLVAALLAIGATQADASMIGRFLKGDESRSGNGPMNGKPPKDGRGPPPANGTVNGTEGRPENHTEGGKPPKDGKIPNVTFSIDDASSMIKTAITPLLTATLLPNETKRYVIGYGHVGKEVKANLTINQTVAEAMLTGDLYRAAGCVDKELIKKSKAVFTAAQTTALVSFTQSIPCEVLSKYYKANKLASTASASDILAFFTGLIASADAARSESSEVTALRAAQVAYFSA